MDTELLQAFVMVTRQNSFSLAAAHLGLTQSAISKRIALLEKQIAQPLFDRVGRGIQLTEAGETLLPRAKHILQEIEDTQQLMTDLGGHISGQLRIATSHHIGLHRLPSILKNFSQEYPAVHLDLHFIDSEQAIQAILQGEFDLALITLPETILNDEIDNIQHHVLWQDPMGFVVNREHPLNQKLKEKKSVGLKDFTQYPAILPDRSTYTTQLIQQLFDDEDQPLTISMTTNHLDAIKMMISVGLGWSVLPETLMKSEIVKVPVSNLRLSRKLGCIYHRNRTLANATRAMLTNLKNER